MKISRIRIGFVAAALGLCALSYAPSTAQAEVVPGCSSITPVGGGLLWKPDNVHGGRGGSFLMGCQIHNSKWPTNTNPLPILNRDGTQIGKLGLYDRGHRPYGRRYYMKVSGGSFTEVGTLRTRALLAGSTNIYVNAGSRGCYRITTPTERDGAIYPQLPVNGNAPC